MNRIHTYNFYSNFFNDGFLTHLFEILEAVQSEDIGFFKKGKCAEDAHNKYREFISSQQERDLRL